MSTEEKIQAAAERIFVRDGYDGARMQAIADEAGINKALLHYYFQSKEGLFRKVFLAKLSSFLPRVGAYFFSERSLLNKMEYFVDAYLDLLIKNPEVPQFVLATMRKYPDFLQLFPRQFFLGILEYIQSEVDAGNVRPVQPRQFFTSVMGMIIFPFLGWPILSHFMELTVEQRLAFMEERRRAIKEHVRAILIG